MTFKVPSHVTNILSDLTLNQEKPNNASATTFNMKIKSASRLSLLTGLSREKSKEFNGNLRFNGPKLKLLIQPQLQFKRKLKGELLKRRNYLLRKLR